MQNPKPFQITLAMAPSVIWNQCALCKVRIENGAIMGTRAHARSPPSMGPELQEQTLTTLFEFIT